MSQQTKQIEIKEETITAIKSKMEEDLKIADDEEIEELKELKKKSYSDSLFLGLLYFRCYNILQENKSISEIKQVISQFEMSEKFHGLIESYETQEYGKYYIKLKIRDYVLERKTEMSKLVDVFFSLFTETI